MLTQQEKIKTIYEKIANKNLSFGCRIMLKNQEIVMENQPVEYGTLEHYEVVWSIIGRYWTLYWWWVTVEIEKIYFNDSFYSEEEVSDGFKEEFSFNEDDEEKDWNLEIIRHPVMLGDVMEYFYGSIRFSEWGKCWRKLTKPIEDQSTECIDFVYDLISKN